MEIKEKKEEIKNNVEKGFIYLIQDGNDLNTDI